MSSLARVTTLATPDGPFTIIAADAVLASGWSDDVESLRLLIHPTLRPTTITTADQGQIAANSPLGQAASAVEAYYTGDLDAPSAIPVTQRSGEFREQAWETLRLVEPGEAITYTQFAARAGRPAAVRAAASACAFNAAALFVPCHRILRSDGSLGGFRYGPAIKESLLRREGTSPFLPGV